jgi:hypothetical protein
MKINNMGYDPIAGWSWAEVSKGEHFVTVDVLLRPEDDDIASSFAGCQFALLKAQRKLYKFELAELRKELKVLENVYTQFTQLRTFEECKHSQVCQHMRKIIKMKTLEVDQKKELITVMEENYPIIIEERLARARELPKMLETLHEMRKAQIPSED